MLVSVSSVLQEQHENFHTTKDIMIKLEDLLRGQVALARQSATTNLMNSQHKISTPVKEHILKLMGFFVEAEDNEDELDMNTQIEIVFKSLTKEFAGFKVAYKALTLTQFMKDELILNLFMN
ncbi:hypothetical protein PVK06_035701 [Gossypium arboreum]|uniref:Uncharacterized protein n=1 Tax=Gossypium arboreum TaxID=29729 RepID=A0ABR0NHI4_GOSAR|nr:hypothetical protein PVK06_035701 [Gossypium arboreum]